MASVCLCVGVGVSSVSVLTWSVEVPSVAICPFSVIVNGAGVKLSQVRDGEREEACGGIFNEALISSVGLLEMLGGVRSL